MNRFAEIAKNMSSYVCTALQTPSIMAYMKTSLCKFCGSPVYAQRHWQEFCGDRCRWRYWSQEHPRTRIEGDPSLTPCYYCGLPGTTVDHVPPISFRSRLRDFGLAGRYPEYEVHACHECNCALGAKPLFSLGERKRYVKGWLKRKYERFLRQPPWSDGELAELGYTLRTKVLSSLLAAEVTKARVQW